MVSFLGQELKPEVSPRVYSAECSHRLAVDVKGDTYIDDSLPGAIDESDGA